MLRGYVEVETAPGAWQAQSPKVIPDGTKLVGELNRQLVTFRPEGRPGDEAVYSATLRSFNEFVERRRDRIQAAGTSVPPILWYIVLIGAALNAFVLARRPRDPPDSRRGAEFLRRTHHLHGGRPR